MTESVQSVDVSVVGKKTAVSRYGVGSDVALKEASVVQLNVTRADVKDVVRQGDNLLVTLSNGQVVTVRGYFLKFDGLQNNLVLEDDLEGQWLLNVGEGAESGSVPFGFTNIQSIDPLLMESGPSDERDAVLGVWHSALAALTIGAMLHDGRGAPEKSKLATPIVDPVNGVDPITGTSEPGATVIVTLPNGSTTSAVADANGKFSAHNPGLNDGDEITVVATSPNGIDSDPVKVTVDALPPDVPTVEPVNATDPIVGHAEPGSTVTVTLPDGNAVTTVADANGKFEISIPGLKDGDKLTVTATDVAGNVSDKTEVAVDGVAPTLDITDNVSGIVGADGSVKFTFTFSEDVKDFDASKVQIQGGVAGEFVAVSGSVYTLVIKPNLAENGELKVQVPAGAAHDAAGNPSAAAEANQSVDPVAPGDGSLYDIVLTDDVGSVTGEIKSGDETDDSKPTYSGKADKTDVVLVQIYDNGKVIGNAVVGADGGWTFEPKLPLAAGPHKFQAQAVDAAGNMGDLTEAVSFNLDGPAPAAPAITGVFDDLGTITGNIQKGYPTDDQQPTIEGTATPGTVVKIWDGDVMVGSAEVDARGQWTITTDKLSDGEHKLTATATDGAGQVSPSTGEYLVLVDTIAPAKPDVPNAQGTDDSIVGPGSDDTTVDTATPVLIGHGEPGEKAAVYDNGVLLGTATVADNGVWTYVPSVGLSQGAHEVSVTLTDKAGNTSVSSDALHFTVDTSLQPLSISHALDDVAPVVVPVPDGGSTDDVTPTLIGRAPAGTTVTIYEGSTVLGNAQTDANGDWRLALPEQSEGVHAYSARTQNEAGVQLTAEFELTIDLTPPTAPSIDAVGDDVGTHQVDLVSGASTDDTTPTIHGSGPAGDVINIYDNGNFVASTAVDAEGKWEFTLTPPFDAEGEHVLTASSVDDVGNESAPSEGFVVVLDVTPPDISKVELTIEKVAGDDYVNIAESQGDVTLTGKLLNVPSDVADSKIVVIVGDVEFAATLVGDTWTAKVPGTAMIKGGEGAATLEVKATLSDAAGNEAQLQITHEYMVDTTPLPEDWEKVAAALWDDVDPVQGEITSGMSTNDSKPIYKGVAESNAGVAYVDILDNGVVIGRAEVQTDGSWSFEPDAALAKGDHVFQARPADIAGNAGVITPAIAFVLEGAQPLPPAIEDVQDNMGPFTGNIQKGVPTDDATPTLSGTAEHGTVVKVFDRVDGNPVLIGEVAVNAAGQWTIEVSKLTDGAHHLFATATDAAGQESDATGEYLVLVDTSAPTNMEAPSAIDNVGDKTGPIHSGDVTDDSAPEFTGTVEAGGGVQIYDNGNLIGSTTAGDNGDWTFTPPKSLDDGAHSITVVVVDPAGNVSEPSEALEFGVNTESLELVLQQVTDNVGDVTGPIANGGATDDATPTFAGKATAGATVSILEEGTPVASVVADVDGKWSIALPVQEEGAHAYTISALSTSGNTATEEFALTIDITPPEAPEIGGVTDDVGSVQTPLSNGGVTDDTTPTLEGTGAPGQTINVYDNGTFVGSTAADANGEWTYTVNPAFTSEGEHELVATSVDAVGNESTVSEPFLVILDVTPPDVSKVQLTVNPVAEDNIVNATESAGDVTLTGSLSGVPSDVSKTTLDVIVNGAHYEGSVSGSTWSVSVPGGALSSDTDKQIEVVAKFTDEAGNSAQKQVTQSYSVDTIPPSPDSLLEYALMDDVGDKQGEILAGDVTDDSKPRYVGRTDDGDVATVRLLDNGQEVGIASVNDDGTWWVEPNSPLGAGPHSFQLQAIDTAGNASESTSALAFTVAGAAPQAPAITGVYDDAGANIQPHQPTNDATPTLEGTATLGTEVTVYEITADGGRVAVGTALVDGKGLWSISTENLTDGTHDLIATATDGAGQESVPTGIYSVNVDTVAPDRPDPVQVIDQTGDKVGALVSGETTDDATPELKGAGEVGAKVTVYDGTEIIGSTTVDESGQWTLTPATGLAQGDHSITVTLTDKAGNASEPSDALSFNVGTEGIELLIDQVQDNYGDITGAIANGGSTDDATPTFIGKATAGATVSILEGTTVVTSVVADAKGDWSIALPTQTEGAHAYTVNAKSVAGNTATESFTLTVDLTPPEAPTIGGVGDDVGSLQVPLIDGGVTDDTTPSLSGDGTPGQTINIYDNGNFVGTTTVDPNGEWSYTVNPAITNEGKHELSATSVDAVGNESEASKPFEIVLDVTPPDVSKVQMTVNAVTDDNVINAAEQSTDITLSGSLVNLPSDVDAAVVSVKVGGATYEAVIDGDTWSVSVRGEVLVADPDHVVEVIAKLSDAAGNTAQVLVSHAYETKVTAPDPSSIHDIVILDDIGEVTGAITDGVTTDDSKPTVSGKADYPEVALVQVLDNDLVIGSASVDTTGNWRFEPDDPLEVGAHSLQFRPVDAAGNIGGLTQAIDFSLAGDAPEQPVIDGVSDEGETQEGGDEVSSVDDLVALQANMTTEDEMDSATERAQSVATLVTNDTTPTLKGTAVAGTTVKLYDVAADGTRVLVGSTIASAKGTWSVTSTLLTESTHNFIATSTDSAGQISAPSVSFQLIVDITPPAKPALAQVTDNAGDITGLVSNGGVMDDTKPVIKGVGEVGSKVKVYDNGTLVGTTVVDADGQWSFQPSTDMNEGKHSITTTQTDKAGNTSASSDAMTFTLDTTPPKVSDSKLSVDNVTEDNVINQAESQSDVTITGKLTGVPADSVNTKVVVTVDGTAYEATLNGDTWSTKVPGSALLKDADLTVDVQATFTDAAGNAASLDASKTYITDSTPPVVTNAKLTVNNVTDDNVVNQTESQADVAITGQLTGVPADSVNTKVMVTVDGTAYEAMLNGDTWSAKVPGSALLKDADLTVDVQATFTDAAGNAATLDASKSYTADSTPPMVTNAKLTVNNVTDDNVVNQSESQADVAITGQLTGVPADSVNTKVVVTVDGNVYEATLNGDTWSTKVPGSALLKDADLTVDVQATFIDAAGNAASLDASKTYTADSTPPVVTNAKLTVNNVTDDNVVNQAESQADVAITGQLTGVPVDSVNTKLVVTVDGTAYDATLNGDTWSTKVPGSALIKDADLTVDVQATFTDEAGNTASLDASKVYQKYAVPPDVANTSLTVNNVTDDNVINQAESLTDIAISGALKGVPVDATATKVVVTVDGTEYQATLNGQTWSTNVPGSVLLSDADSTLDVVASFTDAAGNVSVIEVEKTYVTKATPPALTSVYDIALYDDIGSIQGPILAGSTTDDHQPTYSGKATYPEVTVVQILDKGVVIGEAEVQSNGKWSFEPESELTEGAHSLQARPVDFAGNVGTASDFISFWMAGEAPTSPIISGTEDEETEELASNLNDAATTVVMGDAESITLEPTVSRAAIQVRAETVATDDVSTVVETVTEVESIVDDGSVVATEPDSVTEPEAVTEPESVTETPIALQPEEVTDTEAVTEPESVTTPVDDTVTPIISQPEQVTEEETLTPPEAVAAPEEVTDAETVSEPQTISAPVSPTAVSSLPVVVTNDTTPTLKGTAIAGTYVKLYVQDSAGAWVLVGNTVADAAGKWSVPTLTELAEGTYRYMATSTDASGQVSAPSTEFLLTVDITKPAQMDVPQVWDDFGSITGAVADGGFTDDKLPEISGTGEVGAKVTVYDNRVALGTTVVAVDGKWMLQPSTALSEGAHAISAMQKDAAGNVSSASEALHFTVDTVPSTTTSSVFYIDNVGEQQGMFASGSVTDDRTPTLFGALSTSLEAGASVVIYEGGNRLGVATVNGSDWSFALPTALGSGTAHDFSVQIIDAAGNSAVAAEIDLKIALTLGVNSSTTDDSTPLVVGAIGAELLPGEHLEVIIDGTTYSSQNGVVAVDSHNGIWYVQVPDSGTLGVGSHHVVSQLVDGNGAVVIQASGSLAIEASQGNGGDGNNANTDWATLPGDVTNNTMVIGLNDDGLWTIAANRQSYSSTDLSTYTASSLGNLAGQSASRTVVSMTAADFDRDGTIDVFGTENRYDGKYQIMWENTGNGYAAQKLSVGNELIYWGAVIAYDKTGDGFLDLAYGDRYGDSVTYIANTAGALTPDGNKNGDAGMTSCKQSSFGEVSSVDINGDGTVDIARHDEALGNYTLSVITNNGAGKLSVGQSVDDVFYKNEKNSVTTASMTWADFNGDGYVDLYLATGKTSNGVIYYNDGTGLLNTAGVSVEASTASRCAPLTSASGFLSVATDWNHDGRMDVVKFSTYATQQTAKLYVNNGNGVWASEVMSSTLSNVTGIAAMDYNWDGAKDLIVSQQNGKIVYIENKLEVADGTALHLQIVDSEGVNVYYGNTVQLHDSTGKLVAAQILNAQSGYGVNDTSGLVSFYGLDASETYTATLLKVTNGVSSNVTWDGLEASDGTNAYALSATAGTGVTSGTLTGTGYNDTFVAEAGTHTFDGSGGWSASGDSESWSNTGGLDVVDFRNATSAVNVELGSTAVQGNAQIKATLVDIEGVAGSDYGDKLTGSAGNDWIEGRGGNDTIVLTNGGKDTLAYNEVNASDVAGGNGSDVVTGFKVGSWEALANTDRIDLSTLLQDYKPVSGGESAAMYIDGVATINAGDAISKYLKVNTTAAGTEIQVDTHGDGVDYTTVVTLSGVQTDLATLLANHQISLV